MMVFCQYRANLQFETNFFKSRDIVRIRIQPNAITEATKKVIRPLVTVGAAEFHLEIVLLNNKR